MRTIATIARAALSTAVGPFVLCALLLAAPPAPNQGTFRVISKLPAYTGPTLSIEGSPGLFYGEGQIAGTGISAIFSVTIQGATKTLTNFPNPTNIAGLPAMGANGRLYDGAQSPPSPGYTFSVSATGNVQQYPPQSVTPWFAQSLPNGKLLGAGVVAGTTAWDLVNVDLQGKITTIYQFPASDYPFPLSSTPATATITAWIIAPVRPTFTV